jgi:hypothetical protein
MTNTQTRTNREKLIFAKFLDDMYMAATKLEKIVERAKTMFPEVDSKDIVPISIDSIPRKYDWSIRRVDHCRDWEGAGSYCLIANFEKSRHLIDKYLAGKVLRNRRYSLA